jgi:hypothetical protein
MIVCISMKYTYDLRNHVKGTGRGDQRRVVSPDGRRGGGEHRVACSGSDDEQ